MGFRRFLAIVAAVGVLAFVSRLILGLGSIPGGLRLIMVLGLAAVVGLAIADSGPSRRPQAAAAGPRFVVAARPTWRPTDARSLPKPWRDSRMPREARPGRPARPAREREPWRSRTFRPLRGAAQPALPGRLPGTPRPRDGGEPRSPQRHRPLPANARRERDALWRRPRP